MGGAGGSGGGRDLLCNAAEDVVLVGGERVGVRGVECAHLKDELAAEPSIGVDIALEDRASHQIRSVGLADSCMLGQQYEWDQINERVAYTHLSVLKNA